MAATQELPEARRNEIAYALLKDRMRRTGINLSTNTRREIVDKGKKLGIRPDEAIAFVEPIVRELVEEIFAKPE